MDIDKGLKWVKDLEELQRYAEAIDIPSLNKEKILKCIEFELDLIMREFSFCIGKITYENMRMHEKNKGKIK